MPIQICGITMLQVEQKLYPVGSNFAEIHINAGNEIETLVSAQNEWAQVLQFDENGLCNLSVSDAENNQIIINESGIYSVYCSIGCEKFAPDATQQYEFEIQKNNGAIGFPHIHAIRAMRAGATDWASISMSGVINLDEGDTVELWIKNITSDDSLLFVACNLYLIEQICRHI